MTHDHRPDSRDGQQLDPIELVARAYELYVPARPEFRDSVRARLAEELDRGRRPAVQMIAIAASLLMIVTAGLGGYAAGQRALGSRDAVLGQRLDDVEAKVAAQHKEYETTIRNLQSELKTARAEVDRLSPLVADIPNAIQRLDTQAKAQRESFETEVQELREALTQADSRSKTTIAGIQAELADTKAKVGEFSARVADTPKRTEVQGLREALTQADSRSKMAIAGIQAELADTKAKVGEFSARVADIPNKYYDYEMNISINDPKRQNPATFNKGDKPDGYLIPQSFGKRVKSAVAVVTASMDQVCPHLNSLRVEVDKVMPDHVRLFVGPSNGENRIYGLHIYVHYIED